MPDLVETVIEDPRWETVALPELAERAARAALAAAGLDPDRYEIALLGADDARIAGLNADFRGRPQPTNVLSWPTEDLAPDEEGAPPEPPSPGGAEPESLGDIALAFDTCAAEAAAAGLPLSDHVAHLVVHATLHLLGYDHAREGDAARMERLEAEILASLGVADPYS